MKSNSEENLEKLVSKIMKDVEIEGPSLSFTSIVMSRVRAAQSMHYKPLIPNSVFTILFGSFGALTLYLSINNTPQKESWLGSLGFNVAQYMSFNFSSITMYSVLIATLMVFTQIFFLKKYFDKQSEKQMLE